MKLVKIFWRDYEGNSLGLTGLKVLAHQIYSSTLCVLSALNGVLKIHLPLLRLVLMSVKCLTILSILLWTRRFQSIRQYILLYDIHWKNSDYRLRGSSMSFIRLNLLVWLRTFWRIICYHMHVNCSEWSLLYNLFIFIKSGVFAMWRSIKPYLYILLQYRLYTLRSFEIWEFWK